MTSRFLLRLALALFLTGTAASDAAAADGLLGLPDPLGLTGTPPAHVEPPTTAEAKSVRPAMALPEAPVALENIPSHRQLMREIVIELARYAHERDPSFVVLARGGLDLLHKGEREALWERLTGKVSHPGALGAPVRPYIRALDGLVVDGYFCGRRAFGEVTPPAIRETLGHFTAMVRGDGGKILSIEHCPASDALAAIGTNQNGRVAVHAAEAPGAALNRVPRRRPLFENADHVTDIHRARNFLPVLEAPAGMRREDWLMALQDSNHDALIVDAFPGGRMLTRKEVASLRYKRLGSRRLVLAVVPVAVAEDDMPYWQTAWRPGDPDWLGEADSARPGVTYPRYWRQEWKEILGRHFKAVMDLGFDGVMLDGLETYLRFEAALPLPAES